MIVENLKLWAIERIKYKDIFFKKLKNIDDSNDNFILVEYNNSSTLVLVMKDLDVENIRNKDAESDLIDVIVLNSESNFDLLIKKWDILAKINNLKIHFVNPKLKENNFWIINPSIHNKIIEQNTLKKGLRTLFESV